MLDIATDAGWQPDRVQCFAAESTRTRQFALASTATVRNRVVAGPIRPNRERAYRRQAGLSAIA